jgi:hypothetical protein
MKGLTQNKFVTKRAPKKYQLKRVIFLCPPILNYVTVIVHVRYVCLAGGGDLRGVRAVVVGGQPVASARRTLHRLLQMPVNIISTSILNTIRYR